MFSPAATAQNPPGNGIIQFTKAIYNSDEKLVAHFRVAEDDYFRLRLEAPGRYPINRSLYHEENTIEIAVGLEYAEPFRDFTVFLNDAQIGHLRVIRNAPPAHGSLQVQGGQFQDFKQPVLVTRRVPERLNAEGKPIPMVFQLVSKARALRGGAVLPEVVMFSETLQPGTDQVELPAHTEIESLLPRPYEVRLLQDGFVIDRQSFDVIVRELPGALTITSFDHSPGARRMEVSFDAPHIDRDGNSVGYWLKMVEVEDSGLRTPETFQFVQWAEPGKSYTFGLPLTGGNFAVQLQLETYESSSYLLDELPFATGAIQINVGPASAPSDPTGSTPPAVPFSFTVAGQPQFGYYRIHVPVGEPIPVMMDLSGMQGESAKLTLYRSSEPSMPGPMPGVPPGAEEIDSWDPEDYGKTGLLIGEDLEPGHYSLALSMEFMGQKMPLLTHSFEVVAGGDAYSFSLPEEREVFILGEEPEPDWNRSLQPDMQFTVKALGQRVPGCAIEYRHWPYRAPGFYLASLLRTKADGSAMLATQRGFDIRAEPLPGALGMARAAWTVGEFVPVTVQVPAGHPLRQGGDSVIEIVRLGTRLSGGNESAVQLVYHGGWMDLAGGSGSKEFSFSTPGHYEARLYQGHNLCGLWGGAPYNCVVLDRAAFVVREELPFFNDSDGGLSAFGLASDLDPGDSAWPTIGESLSEEDCTPGERQFEKMELRIVRQVDGQYQEITGPVDFGAAFQVEGRLENPAQREFYPVLVGPPGGQQEEVNLYRDDEDPQLVRSELLYAIWETEEDGSVEP